MQLCHEPCKGFYVRQLILHLTELAQQEVNIIQLLISPPMDGLRDKVRFNGVYALHRHELARDHVAASLAVRQLVGVSYPIDVGLWNEI